MNILVTNDDGILAPGLSLLADVCREVELIMLVKHLLYTEKFTIDGARQRIDQYRRTGELRASARKAFEAELATEVRAAIEEVVKILDGRTHGPRG